MVKTIPFYLRSKTTSVENSELNGLKQVELRITTGGGDCKKQLTVTMQQFFKESGISANGKFVWGRDYFPMEIAGSEKENEEG